MSEKYQTSSFINYNLITNRTMADNESEFDMMMLRVMTNDFVMKFKQNSKSA